MHISPTDRQAVLVAARRDEASASGGRTPAFCGSAPVLTCTNSRGAALPRDFRRQSRGDRGPVEGVDDVEQRHRLARLVGLQRADQMQLEIGMLGL